MKTCIFINSCDKTHDVAEIFLNSFNRFILNPEIKVFMGINKIKHSSKYDFINYVETSKSNWRKETISQLKNLKKNHNYKNVILILDDFIFKKETNTKDLNNYIDNFNKNSLKYLCLIENKKSLIHKLYTYFIDEAFEESGIYDLPTSYPYYSSLQISIWDIDYLVSKIRKSTSIWNFELLRDKNKHFEVHKNIFHYDHIVEKGEWNYNAYNYVKKYLNLIITSNRSFKVGLLGKEIFYLKKFLFNIFGFSFLRIRKFLRK